MRRSVFKLFGVGAALVALALAAGNNGQAGAQTPVVGGYPFSGTRIVYNVLGGVDWPGVIIQVRTDDYNAAQVQTWTGNGWSNVGTPIPPGSIETRSPSDNPSALRIQSQGEGLFWIGATSWGNRTFSGRGSHKIKSGGGGLQCDAQLWRPDDSAPNKAYIVALFHWKNSKYSTRLRVWGFRDGTLIDVPPGQGYIFAARPPFYTEGCRSSDAPGGLLIGETTFHTWR
jgi:hypothetical protein